MVQPVIEREGRESRCGVERSRSSTAIDPATRGQAEVPNLYGCGRSSKVAQNCRILPSTKRCVRARQREEKQRSVAKLKRRASRLAHELPELLNRGRRVRVESFSRHDPKNHRSPHAQSAAVLTGRQRRCALLKRWSQERPSLTATRRDGRHCMQAERRT